ncbi:MAG TPA: alpha/beta hydrolase domain-containing protein [Streptosporangiaceae bacterium]|nr:alpha/beta hydrolase domain-containing protein [Streptosporangiaceae bacterium]
MDGSARLTGPVEGQPGIIMTGFDLGQVGYTLEEFFLEGTADRYAAEGPAGADGHWDVTPSGRAPFATRLVVCRPSDPAAFTGTVILEWLNVSAGFDAPAHWMLTHRHVVRSGWAWVGVSAQRAGIEGGNIFENAGEEPDAASRRTMVLPALKESDPARYGSLHHPGDAFSFDVFAQAARAVRSGAILGTPAVECLLAAGLSQSAIHLVSYVNAVAPTTPPEAECDGYLIGCRTGRAAPLTGWDGRIRTGGPDGVRVRTDARWPVLTVQTETDITGVLAGVTARQPDSARFRWWEIAGASHADTYLLGAAFSDSGELAAADLARMLAPTSEPLGMQCPAPVNSGPQHHYVGQAALAHLDRWARGGAPPPSSPRLETAPDDHMRLLTDEAGIARGGIRTGWVDVPVAALSGLAPEGAPGVAMLLGTTRVFDDAELARRYPGGRDEYAAAFRLATSQAVTAGFLLEQDAGEIVALAVAAYPGRA